MAYQEIDAESIIDRLIDRLIEAERRNASASYIEAMQKFELLKVEHDEASRALAKLRNEVAANKPKLNALWVAADRMVGCPVNDLVGLVPVAETLKKALKEACEACDGDDIPF